VSASCTGGRASTVAGAVMFAALLMGCCACGAPRNSNVAQPSQHSVTLSWTASTSDVVGYNIYRGTQHSGPYTLKLNSSPQAGTTFTDSTVQSGATYYYVVAAQDANQVQSDYSNEVSAIIP